MKKFIFLLFITGFCLSCSKFLDLKPKNQVVVYTLEDVKESVSAYLLAIASDGLPVYFNGDAITYPLDSDAGIAFAMYGDDIDMPTFFDYRSGSGYEKMYTECSDWKGVNVSARVWKRLYVSIGYMNEVLKNLKNAPAGDPDEYQRIAAEARIFRAYYAFKLTQYYSPYKDNDLGIPLNLDAEAIEGPARWKQTEVYQFILKEMHEVLEYTALPTKWNVMYNKDIIRAMLAQVYCFKAGSAAAEATDWQNAEKYSGLLTAKYHLETTKEDFENEFIPKPNIGIVKDNLYSLLTLVRWDSKTGYSFGPWGAEDERLLPTNDLVNLFEEIPGDIRADHAFIGFQEMRGNMKWYAAKWNFYKNRSTYNACNVLFRIAEMYLINAEAKIRQGQTEAARQALIDFRATRIPGYSTVNGDVLQEILKERRKEFCFELDFRYLDIKRLELAVSRQAIDVTTGSSKLCTLDAGDYRYTLPIPNDNELMYNKIPQNPGWNIVK